MIRKFISFLLLFFLILYNFNFSFANEELPIIPLDNPLTQENTETETILEPQNIIPDIIITFQSPSYLTNKDIVQDTYHCDLGKDECKVNFDLSDTFGGYVPAKFACINDFSIDTGEENKCNPATIIFPYGNHTINFKMYEKDNPSNFKEKSITIINEKEENQIDTNTGGIIGAGSGELSQSGSVDMDPETSSGGQNSSIEIPNVDIEIQSGLEFVDSKYKCKETDCKVNLNLEKLFTGIYQSNNYSCEWNFGSGTFTTADTDKKCNPGYVNYGIGNFIIEAKIIDKNNASNFKTGSLIFSNGTIDYFDDSLSSTELNSGSLVTDDFNNSENLSSQGQNTNTGSIEIPNVDIEIQSGIELVDSEYRCKDKNCKVNLNLENLFTGSYESKNYNCLWDFGSGLFDTIDTDKKCNPGYVSYSTGFFSIIAKIEEKDNPLNFKTGSLSFKNLESYTTSNKSRSSCGGSSYITSIKDIILQSGAEKVSEGKYVCSDEVCKINLKYNKSYNDSCLWDFGGGNYREKNIYTCNPGFVYYYNGEYNVNLKINKDGNYIGEKNISIINNYIDKAIEYNIKPIARISLQGKLGKNKELIGNKLICKNSKTCSVNFDGSDSTDANKDNLDFFWDFGNGEYAEKSNPTSIEYLPGKYKIRLKVVDRFGEFSEDYFFVEVYESVEKIEEINQDIIDFIKITEVLPNPIGKEEYEWIKIKNDSKNFVNIKGLEIDDKIGEGSKSYIIKNDVFLLPYQEKKLYKSETKLNLNNSFDEVNLIYNSEIIDSLVWNYEVPEDYVVKKEIKEKVKVIRIIDGDTIVIQFQDGKTEKLRFIGVDTPETKHPKKEVEKFGIEVSNFTKDMLQGKEVFLELDYENYRDKYGRLLGYIWLQDANFNKLLIEKGYARAYLYFPFKYSEDFAKAEKNAKKNKLGIWGNEEVKREIEELKKIEDKQMMKNISFNEGLNFKSIIGRISSLNDSNNIKTKFLLNIKTVFIPKYDKKSIEKEALGEFDVLLGELLPKYNKKIKTTKLKQEKIITYKTSKLKSGLKITGTTFPNAKIILNFDELKYETISDNSGKYSFLISDNLKVGEYKLDFLVFSGEKEYNYEVPKPINLSRDYIFGVQDYKVKKATKKTKTKKSKKTKKKKVLANNNTKKMKYDVKDIKKEEDKSSTKNIFYIFLLSIIATIFGYILVRKN